MRRLPDQTETNSEDSDENMAQINNAMSNSASGPPIVMALTVALPEIEDSLPGHSGACNMNPNSTTQAMQMHNVELPPPKPDFSAPPPYEVATKLPSYEEVQREKTLQGEPMPQPQIHLPTGGIRGQQPLTILAIDTEATDGDPESALLGTDFIFFTAFLRSTNIMGKFTQSVRRIVQDVKDEGTASGQTKEEVIETNERLRAVRIRLDGSYDTAKRALVDLMCKYTDSKQVRNVFQRYNLLKVMIKDVIKLETQYWTLVDIPRQEKQETVPAFVLRACTIMEKTHKSGEGVKTSARLAEEAENKRERIERLEDMITAQIEAENTQMINDLYRLLKKYTGLRNLIKDLKVEYNSSKVYPMFPRYTILKDMIKDIMHNPDYMEVCHEVDQS